MSVFFGGGPEPMFAQPRPHCGLLGHHEPHEWITCAAWDHVVLECPGVITIEGGHGGVR